jgi:hypothetical protein
MIAFTAIDQVSPVHVSICYGKAKSICLCWNGTLRIGHRGYIIDCRSSSDEVRNVSRFWGESESRKYTWTGDVPSDYWRSKGITCLES